MQGRPRRLKELHREHVVGTYDAAVVTKKKAR